MIFFGYSYEGGDGTKAFEKGELKIFDDDKTGEAVVGGFSYTVSRVFILILTVFDLNIDKYHSAHAVWLFSVLYGCNHECSYHHHLAVMQFML